MKQSPKYYLWMKQEGEGCDYTIGESDERLLSNCLLLTANDSSMPVYLEYIKGLEDVQDQSLIQKLQQERNAINQRLASMGAT